MNPRARAFIGAAIGALLVLFAHPVTRPGLIAPFRSVPKGGVASLLVRGPLPPPTNVFSGARYLHVGAQRLLSGPALTSDERRTLLKIAAEGARMEPENAFWRQSEFLFGQDAFARRQWRIGSRCRAYDDHQSLVLEQDRSRLVAYLGDSQAWTYAAVAPRRSDAMARCVSTAIRKALKQPRSQDESDRFACETIRQGALLRDGGRSLKIGHYGIDMIEAATYPPGLAQVVATPHRLWSAKTALTGRLRKQGMQSEADFCERQFRTNDGWEAFRTVRDPEERFQALSLLSTIVAVLPGGLLLAALAGVGVELFGRRIAQIARTRDRFRGPGLTACSLLLLVVGAFLGYPWVGLTAGACALLPGSSPERPRPFDESPLGPLHAFVVGSMALSLLTFTVLIAISRSLPGRILTLGGDVGVWLSDSNRLGAFVVVLLGASSLVAPSWAVVRRYGTPAIAAFTYRGLGREVALGGLIFAIVASPLSLAADRWLGVDLRRIEQNEQIYYNPSESGEP